MGTTISTTKRVQDWTLGSGSHVDWHWLVDSRKRTVEWASWGDQQEVLLALLGRVCITVNKVILGVPFEVNCCVFSFSSVEMIQISLTLP